MPPEEIAIKNTVDHWGLPFSDQFRLYNFNFERHAKITQSDSPQFVIATENALRKTFRNKYWFKGIWANHVILQAGRNEYESFQLAILPKTGAKIKDITVKVSNLKSADGKSVISSSAVKLWRVGFVKTAIPQYPVRHIGDWPDPLLKIQKPFSLKGLDLGLIWCEVKVPRDVRAGDYTGMITVTSADASPQTITIKLKVWNFTLPDRIKWPTLVWIIGDMKSQVYRDICNLFLEHHLDPISVGKTTDLELLDNNLQFCLDRGLMYFQTPGYNPQKPHIFRKYYDHIKKKGWLDKALIYGARDEPTTEEFRKTVVPRTKFVRREFPGLKTFLASEYHPGMGDGTDIWLTDISTNFLLWLNDGRPGKQELWMYFCHLPVRVGFEHPLVDAPNMLIDNDAVEHRVLNWMAWKYGAKGVFIWAGNCSWPKDYDCNPEKAFSLTDKPTTYPYAGIHNGNGFLIYPDKRPSIRLKVLRDGIEDYWYITQVEKLARAGNSEAQKLLTNINPTVFVDTHYFSKDPQCLLNYRNELGSFLDNEEK